MVSNYKFQKVIDNQYKIFDIFFFKVIFLQK